MEIKQILNRHNKILACISLLYRFGKNRIKIKGLNNKVNYNRSFVKHSTIVIKGNNNIINLGDISRLVNCYIYIEGNDNIIDIGVDGYFDNLSCWVENDKNKIILEENCSIHGPVQLAVTEGSNIHIGKECLFSYNITIRTGDSHSILDMDDNRINPAQDVIIGKHVWISQNVIILKGVNIADNIVVAAGSVVTKSFNVENSIIGGNSAKILKENIKWNINRV